MLFLIGCIPTLLGLWWNSRIYHIIWCGCNSYCDLSNLHRAYGRCVCSLYQWDDRDYQLWNWCELAHFMTITFLLDVHLVSYGIQPKRLELSDQVIYFVGGPPHLMHLEFILQTLIHVCQINYWRVGPTYRRVFKRIYITSTKNYLVLANHSCQKHLEAGSIIFKNSYHTLVERHPKYFLILSFGWSPIPVRKLLALMIWAISVVG